MVEEKPNFRSRIKEIKKRKEKMVIKEKHREVISPPGE